MDDSSLVASTPRPSAIPRLSRLPLPRQSLTTTNYAIPATRPLAPSAEQPLKQSIGRQSLLATVRGRPSLLSPPLPSSTVGSVTTRKPAASQTLKRQPLGPPLRPQSKQEPRHQPDQIEVDGVLYVKAHRRLSDQENDNQLQNTGDDSTVTPAESPTDVVSPVPSLSDRTIESLAHIPSGPGSVRRRSSFFNPHSPMTPSRPPSSIDTYSVSKLNYGSVRKSALPRQSTSYAKPSNLSQLATPSRPGIPRRSISSTFNTSTATPIRPAIPSRTGITPAQAITRPASAAAFPRTTFPSQPSGRISAARLTRPSSSLNTSAHVTTTHRPPSRAKTEMKPPAPSTRQPRPLTTTKTIEKTTFKRPIPASATLRSQIAHARSSQRGAALKAPTLSKAVVTVANDEGDEDSFHETNKNETDLLHRRIDSARQDGRLNIASLGFKSIPDEILYMYGAEAMETSSVPWNETVDISRFIAADNELEAISDELFPDLSMEELVDSEDPKGSVFGGIELLDLHGNMLQSLPLGTRRLELLTSLNISRNKFENSIFDVVTQLPSLRELRLADNELSRDLPESIGALANLETLDLHGNKLVLLPTSIRSLVHLRILNLSDNRFSDLSMSELVQLASLTEIYASKNALTGSLFPSTIQQLPHLRILDVSSNSIASLSFSPALSLPSLTHLDVSRNRLFALPDVAEWASLVAMLAEDNQLTDLPPGFTTLDNLKSADFRGNCLRIVDKQVGRMKSLERFSLDGNPLRERKWATMGWETIKREMLQRLEEVRDDDEPGRAIFVVGEGCLGPNAVIGCESLGEADEDDDGMF